MLLIAAKQTKIDLADSIANAWLRMTRKTAREPAQLDSTLGTPLPRCPETWRVGAPRL
jgi:hypothetical protein